MKTKIHHENDQYLHLWEVVEFHLKGIPVTGSMDVVGQWLLKIGMWEVSLVVLVFQLARILNNQHSWDQSYIFDYRYICVMYFVFHDKSQWESTLLFWDHNSHVYF
uniref:Uncharacterized protein n=1 Tax=Cacopsylla melanoneura TaxID=428564 RepID=A0A8D8ZCJ6_9HEMI